MRVAQRTMYQSFVNDMNSSLSAYMNTNIEASSQKRINRPSDDPVGAARVLNYRASLAQDDQFKSNLSTARGWLGETDETMLQVSVIIDKMKGLAAGASTDTVTGDNRLQISYELREMYEQLINIANKDFAGRKLFAGQNYDSSAFVSALAVSSTDPQLANVNFQVEGKLNRAMMVRFSQDSDIPPVGDSLTYEYSKDGGKTWASGLIAEGDNKMDIDGVQITVPTPPGAKVTAHNSPNAKGDSAILYVRPTAKYMGADNSAVPKVDVYGAVDPSFSAKPVGSFDKNVSIRFDDNVDLNQYGEFKYSYSTDGGRNWISAVGKSDGVATTGVPSARLLVPGGYVDVEIPNNANATIPKDTNLVVRPQLANLDYETMEDGLFQVNNVGKDIFGGIYTPLNSNQTMASLGGGGANLFETVGKLVGYAETNNPDGVARCMADLTESLKTITTYATKIGGRENRLDVAEQVLMTSTLDKKERLSNIEDADLTSLLTRLSQQQLAYNTVLKSSSMIMGLNLTKFL